MLNEAMNVVAARGHERAGEVVMLKEILDGGDRALVIGHTDEERVVYLADILRDQPLRSGDSLLLETRSSYAYERIPKSEVEELILEEVPDIDYTDIGGLGRADRGDPRRGRAAVPARRSVPRAPAAPAEGHPAVRPARLRQDAHRQGRRELAGQAGRRRCTAATRRPPRSSSTSRARSCSTSTSARPSGTSGWSSSAPGRRPARARRSSSSSTRWTRSSAPAARASARTSRTRSCRSCSARSTASRGSRTSS